MEETTFMYQRSPCGDEFLHLALEDRELTPSEDLQGQEENPSCSFHLPPPLSPHGPGHVKGCPNSPTYSSCQEGAVLLCGCQGWSQPYFLTAVPIPDSRPCAAAEGTLSNGSVIPTMFWPSLDSSLQLLSFRQTITSERGKKSFETTAVDNKPSQMPASVAVS